MKAADIMTARVVTVHDDAPIYEAARLMLQDDISGLPVMDHSGKMVGIVTESDLLRRVEAGTERRRPRWLEIMKDPGALAEEYVRTHGRTISEVMTRNVVTASEDTPLEEVVLLMERLGIKRIVVTRGEQPVGIVARSNLLQALAKLNPEADQAPVADVAIRERILSEMAALAWMPSATVNALVRFGAVDLHGFIFDERERAALRVLAENVPGVRSVRDHLVLTDPYSGMVPTARADRRTPPETHLSIA